MILCQRLFRLHSMNWCYDFFLFIIFSSVIRVWILLSKISLVIFPKSSFYDLFMNTVNLSSIIIFTYLEYNWENSIISFIVSHCCKSYLLVWIMVVVLTAAKWDYSERITDNRIVILSLWLTISKPKSYVTREKKKSSPKKQNADIFKNF